MGDGVAKNRSPAPLVAQARAGLTCTSRHHHQARSGSRADTAVGPRRVSRDHVLPRLRAVIIRSGSEWWPEICAPHDNHIRAGDQWGEASLFCLRPIPLRPD